MCTAKRRRRDRASARKATPWISDRPAEAFRQVASLSRSKPPAGWGWPHSLRRRGGDAQRDGIGSSQRDCRCGWIVWWPKRRVHCWTESCQVSTASCPVSDFQTSNFPSTNPWRSCARRLQGEPMAPGPALRLRLPPQRTERSSTRLPAPNRPRAGLSRTIARKSPRRPGRDDAPALNATVPHCASCDGGNSMRDGGRRDHCPTGKRPCERAPSHDGA